VALRWSGRRFAPTPLRCSVGRAGAELATRSFGPLRSNSCAESDVEACLSCGRHAARPPCASRRSTGAPPPPHRGLSLLPRPNGPSQNTPCPIQFPSPVHAEPVEARHPASTGSARTVVGVSASPLDALPTVPRAVAGGLGRGRFVGRRGAQARGWACLPKDRHASTSDLPQLFERSERSERSEFCGTAPWPSTAAKSAQRARPPHHEPAPQAPGHGARPHRLASQKTPLSDKHSQPLANPHEHWRICLSE